MITAREAAAVLGGQATTSTSLLCPGPGHSPRDRSLSVRLDPAAPNGFTCHSFAGDDWASCRDHVRAGLGLGLWQPRATPVASPRRTQPPGDEASRIKAALRLWGDCLDARGTLAERYLAGRELELDRRPVESIWFHPRPKYDDRTAPAWWRSCATCAPMCRAACTAPSCARTDQARPADARPGSGRRYQARPR